WNRIEVDQLRMPTIPSHRELVTILSFRDTDRIPKNHLDAVIVPTSRVPTNLHEADRVAHLDQSQLVYLCSKDATASRVYDFLTHHHIDTRHITAVDLPQGYNNHSLPGLQLRTDALSIPRYDEERDIAVKRNVGLALARMAGWKHVFFLDDDVGGIEKSHLNRMLRGFDDPDRQIVGWAYGNPRDMFANDNSAVMHAYRLAGGVQDTFISGGASAVRIGDDTPFFPNIYNEDWLFFAGAMRKGVSSVALAGDVIQLQKNPFARKELVVGEEFGDMYAEGLLRTMYGDRSLTDPWSFTASWWREIMQMRGEFIQDIANNLRPEQSELHRQAHESLTSALAAHRADWPLLSSNYTRDWISDLDTWKSWYSHLPSSLSVSDALAYLHLQRTR
ncbi:MAG: hypothetical protein J2P37_19815, partial [Ktedonobacteraceae bacterium]|nr:hypothetical protein [Ktedonobacteraceae bacterium]